MKTIVVALLLSASATVSADSGAIPIVRYVLSQRATVENQVNEVIEKGVGKTILPLDFSRMKCIESGDKIQPKNSGPIRLGVCILKGDAKSDPDIRGSFAIVVDDKGLTVHPLLVEQE